MEKRNVVLATTTFYKSMEEVRFKCALKTMEEAAQRGYTIVVVDASPNPEIANAFQEEGAIVFSGVVSGMGASRREAVQLALDMQADIVVWLEPEKYPIVPLLAPCIEMVAGGGYDLVVPRRRTLTGYPFYQHWSEMEASWRLGEITGRPDLDTMIGPRVMNRQVAELFLEYKGEPYGDFWQSIFLVVLRALARGMSVGSRTVDYVHPPEQTAEEQNSPEMDRKRDEQRIILIQTMQKEAEKLGYRSHLA
jgi:hypothetical protein